MIKTINFVPIPMHHALKMYRERRGIRESVVDSGNVFNIPEINTFYSPPPVALQPNAGHGLSILKVSRSHTTT